MNSSNTRKAHGVKMAFNPASKKALTRHQGRFHQIRVNADVDAKLKAIFMPCAFRDSFNILFCVQGNS